MVRRIYVEKKKGFDVEAAQLFADVKENLHLDGLQGIRILNRYDIVHETERLSSYYYDLCK